MFWTDATQAQERLAGTVISYDKKPVLIENIRVDANGKDAADCFILGKNSKRTLIPLEDDKWNNFRDLPKLGWFNYVGEGNKIVPIHLERRAINTRQHGLSNNNVTSVRASLAGVERDRYFNLIDYLGSTGYLETTETDEAYPKLSQILMSLDDTPAGVAFSPRFCVIVTEEGMKWLFRKNRRIGFFTGTDSLNLFPRNGFYKEELQAVPAFDINNIREF
jgi:hypothetical protein